MRLNADMIARSPAFFNAMKDRELDLRGELLCAHAAARQPLDACASPRGRHAWHTTCPPLSSPPTGTGNKISVIENLAATQVPPLPAQPPASAARAHARATSMALPGGRHQ